MYICNYNILYNYIEQYNYTVITIIKNVQCNYTIHYNYTIQCNYILHYIHYNYITIYIVLINIYINIYNNCCIDKPRCISFDKQFK